MPVEIEKEIGKELHDNFNESPKVTPDFEDFKEPSLPTITITVIERDETTITRDISISSITIHFSSSSESDTLSHFSSLSSIASDIVDLELKNSDSWTCKYETPEKLSSDKEIHPSPIILSKKTVDLSKLAEFDEKILKESDENLAKQIKRDTVKHTMMEDKITPLMEGETSSTKRLEHTLDEEMLPRRRNERSSLKKGQKLPINFHKVPKRDEQPRQKDGETTKDSKTQPNNQKSPTRSQQSLSKKQSPQTMQRQSQITTPKHNQPQSGGQRQSQQYISKRSQPTTQKATPKNVETLRGSQKTEQKGSGYQNQARSSITQSKNQQKGPHSQQTLSRHPPDKNQQHLIGQRSPEKEVQHPIKSPEIQKTTRGPKEKSEQISKPQQLKDAKSSLSNKEISKDTKSELKKQSKDGESKLPAFIRKIINLITKPSPTKTHELVVLKPEEESLDSKDEFIPPHAYLIREEIKRAEELTDVFHSLAEKQTEQAGTSLETGEYFETNALEKNTGQVGQGQSWNETPDTGSKAQTSKAATQSAASSAMLLEKEGSISHLELFERISFSNIFAEVLKNFKEKYGDILTKEFLKENKITEFIDDKHQTDELEDSAKNMISSMLKFMKTDENASKIFRQPVTLDAGTDAEPSLSIDEENVHVRATRKDPLVSSSESLKESDVQELHTEERKKIKTKVKGEQRNGQNGQNGQTGQIGLVEQLAATDLEQTVEIKPKVNIKDDKKPPAAPS